MGGSTIGPFEGELLSSLMAESDDAYGITLRDRLKQSTGRSVSLGAIYTALERLEKKGFVSSWWGDPTPERGGRRKRLYKIEITGRQACLHFQARSSGSMFGFGDAGVVHG